ncbi:MAG TPA: SH3 domain-containing protein [Thermoanaerobaculia bacterium]|nr:SH3 domain-containing protein [Thermoanaerobaculia bacterium]
MKRIVIVHVMALLLLAACKQERTVTTGTTPVDSREPIAVRYVGSPELPVREQASDTAPIVATYLNGEAISVLAEKGEWVEVRSGDGSGWARAADLTSAEAIAEAEENPQPKFKIMPMPVSAPSARGEIYLEADVNSDGDILAVRTITNTTGSLALEAQNTAALKASKFHPIVQNNQRVKFKYYHRVTY